jgi:hypothetical protein
MGSRSARRSRVQARLRAVTVNDLLDGRVVPDLEYLDQICFLSSSNSLQIRARCLFFLHISLAYRSLP